jgi:hypothetical protein
MPQHRVKARKYFEGRRNACELTQTTSICGGFYGITARAAGFDFFDLRPMKTVGFRLVWEQG